MNNLNKQFLFIGMMAVVLYDIITIFILHLGGWTWLGFITFAIALSVVVWIWEDFANQDKRRRK